MEEKMVSKYVSYKELTYSNTAVANNIDNNPNPEQYARIKDVCEKVFDPLRDLNGGAIKINSGFRSAALNAKVGGSNTSQHSANNGAALDLHNLMKGKDNSTLFHLIKDNIEFDQMIGEFPENGIPSWVHVSYVKGKNRKEILIAIKKEGKTNYIPYKGNEKLIKVKD